MITIEKVMENCQAISRLEFGKATQVYLAINYAGQDFSRRVRDTFPELFSAWKERTGGALDEDQFAAVVLYSVAPEKFLRFIEENAEDIAILQIAISNANLEAMNEVDPVAAYKHHLPSTTGWTKKVNDFFESLSLG